MHGEAGHGLAVNGKAREMSTLNKRLILWVATVNARKFWPGDDGHGKARNGKARQGLSIQRIASTGCYAVVIPPVMALQCMAGQY